MVYKTLLREDVAAQRKGELVIKEDGASLKKRPVQHEETDCDFDRENQAGRSERN